MTTTTGGAVGAVSLPQRLDGVTPAWLTAALATRHPGVEVTAVSVGEVLHGTATKARLLVRYNDVGERAGLPQVMWVKAGFEEHHEIMVSAGAYRNEASFYRDLRPSLPVNTPECLFVNPDDRSGQSVLLLEDLVARGVRFGRATRPLTLEEVTAGVDAMALWHAHWWASPALDDIRWLRGSPRRDGGRSWFTTRGVAGVADDLRRPRAAAAPYALHDPERLLEAVWRLWEKTATPPLCFTHGDAHVGNMYFERDGSAGFYDWQVVRKARWAFDFTYFVVSGLDIPDRRRWEHTLLEHYLGALETMGVDAPSLDDAWLDHRRHTAYGLWAWLGNAESWQPEDVNIACVARFGAAAADLDMFDSLETA